jgi:hypothetical protein
MKFALVMDVKGKFCFEMHGQCNVVKVSQFFTNAQVFRLTYIDYWAFGIHKVK